MKEWLSAVGVVNCSGEHQNSGRCHSHRLYSYSCDCRSKLSPALFSCLTVDHTNFWALTFDRWTIAFEQQMSSSHSAVYHRITKGPLIIWKRRTSNNMRYDCIWLILVWYIYTPMLSWSFRYTANGTRSELNTCVLLYLLFQEIYIIIYNFSWSGVISQSSGGSFKMFW